MNDMPHTISNRGFKHMEPVEGVQGYGGSVRVYESSGAAGARIWLLVTSGEGLEEAVHLDAKSAATLARQIEWLLRNHYQGDAWPEEEVMVADLQALQEELQEEPDA